jgi:hypothetical protein
VAEWFKAPVLKFEWRYSHLVISSDNFIPNSKTYEGGKYHAISPRMHPITPSFWVDVPKMSPKKPVASDNPRNLKRRDDVQQHVATPNPANLYERSTWLPPTLHP